MLKFFGGNQRQTRYHHWYLRFWVQNGRVTVASPGLVSAILGVSVAPLNGRYQCGGCMNSATQLQP